jgi:hypothetical protein
MLTAVAESAVRRRLERRVGALSAMVVSKGKAVSRVLVRIRGEIPRIGLRGQRTEEHYRARPENAMNGAP